MMQNPSGIDWFEKLLYWCCCGNWTIWELREKNELYEEFQHDCDPYGKKWFCFEPEIDQKKVKEI